MNNKLLQVARRLMPLVSQVLLTVIVVVGVLWANSAGALPLPAPRLQAASTETIAYQGRLADNAGAPLDGNYPMTFRLYATAAGVDVLWLEQWANVPVQGGLFNVLLGSITPLPASLFADNDSLYLGITVGADSEMIPRVQVGSVPYAMRALNVSTGGGDIPSGMIAMWSGALADIPEGWSLCDGTGGTPDLTDRFILSVPDSSTDPGAPGGSHTIDLRHTHRVVGTTDREDREKWVDDDPEDSDVANDNHRHDVDITSRGASSTASPAINFGAVDIRPKYYKLAFIMKD